MKATRIGEIRTNPDETRQLRRELTYWTDRLSDDLGAPKNPFGKANNFVGTMNAIVAH
jgi:hypothetical protein